MKVSAAKYLGMSATQLLDSAPFSSWSVERTADHDLSDEVTYRFVNRGVEVLCTSEDIVETIFFTKNEGELLVGIPFSWSRKQVLEYFGVPESSGAASWLSGLGQYGPWDRFEIENGYLHVQYCSQVDQIEMITLMRAGAAP